MLSMESFVSGGWFNKLPSRVQPQKSPVKTANKIPVALIASKNKKRRGAHFTLVRP
jgi:hypothetical protein